MWTWISDLRGIDAVFFGCAAIGGTIFLIRVILIFIGLGALGALVSCAWVFDYLLREHPDRVGQLIVPVAKDPSPRRTSTAGGNRPSSDDPTTTQEP